MSTQVRGRANPTVKATVKDLLEGALDLDRLIEERAVKYLDERVHGLVEEVLEKKRVLLKTVLEALLRRLWQYQLFHVKRSVYRVLGSKTLLAEVLGEWRSQLTQADLDKVLDRVFEEELELVLSALSRRLDETLFKLVS